MTREEAKEIRALRARTSHFKLPILPRIRDELRGADNFIHAVAYELSDGGDLVRGKPHLRSQLANVTHFVLSHYEETHQLSLEHIYKELIPWHRVNEAKSA